MRILFIDTETTGTNPDKHGLVEIAASLYNAEGVPQGDPFNEKCFDKSNAKAVSLGALKVNGLTIDDLMSAQEEGKVIKDFVQYLMLLEKDGPLLVCGQNVKFDLDFLKRTLSKYGVEDLESIIGYKHIDLFGIAIFAAQAGLITLQKNNLAGIATAVGIDVTKYKLHTALDDVKLCADTYFKLLELLKSKVG